MNRLPSQKKDSLTGENAGRIIVFCGKYRVFAAFLICAAILTAVFAIGCILSETEIGREYRDRLYGWLSGNEQTETSTATAQREPNVEVPEGEAEQPIPEHAIPVLKMDLSHTSRGEGYFLNETDYTPSVVELAERKLGLMGVSFRENEPVVLIIHTHTRESYLQEGVSYVEGELSAQTFAVSADENVVAVGRALYERLSERGIPTLHCTVDHMHDGMLQGAYDRAAQSIESYRKLYPSIQLVIDLHRDAVLTADGEYIKSAAASNDGLAQIMPVVGSDRNGTKFSHWEDNLALAVQLRRVLNAAEEGICRPVYIRSSSYNQELAPYALLLEIGTGGNSLEEAKRTARILGDALAQLLLNE